MVPFHLRPQAVAENFYVGLVVFSCLGVVESDFLTFSREENYQASEAVRSFWVPVVSSLDHWLCMLLLLQDPDVRSRE